MRRFLFHHATTTITSLVNSSIRVIAGVYLLIRFNIFVGLGIKFYLRILRITTFLTTGISANYEYDLKNIIEPAKTRIRQFTIQDRLT